MTITHMMLGKGGLVVFKKGEKEALHKPKIEINRKKIIYFAV